ncbi:gamma-glutamyl-gamma-aminobutyrate hydrolase family protein [Oscillatoria sp. FACHB-1407]|uniref:gamma-glutamyl-gamma-aminobutyrate hydrolase family protein n=1 Tax=Oscillatoria sp. FACHB-1407 TaxID=2692847 RepID=UPI001683E78F|nr:gamma-glutamyl-gamma-aminobutyrate hydrolase family protein [Oscillatoria sp. FACHB-1407]MBD2462841.1 gamma-glutamyl-gamma-aminobutyrate hydrolase family protein [Oscillatoria sp. FACHB-1407]
MTSPLIGITTYGRNDLGEFHLYAAYVDAVRRAGGVPILLPPGEPNLDRLIERVDGLVFTGGGDIEPTHYDGDLHPKIYRLDSERDSFELALARRAIQADLPLLGICRGLQVLSVASGGKLLPHVPDTFGTDVLHREEPLHPTKHPVAIAPQSLISKIVGVSEMEVVSWHHQAVPTVPPGWQATAYAPDGLIEALEHQDHPWAIALQWHPELSAATDPLQQRIFNAFVQVAQTRLVNAL